MANIIIGGYFGLNPWQRGTSFVAVANGDYTADRFEYNKVGAMVHTIQRSSDVPIVSPPYMTRAPVYRNSVLIDCTTADASIAAGDYCYYSYKVEGYDFNFLDQRTFSLRFSVKATKTGTYCIAFRNAGKDKSCIIEYTVNSAGTWEEKLAVVSNSPPSAGTWDYENGIGLEVSFILAAGTTFQNASADSWLTGNYMATSNQVNACDSTSNNFQLDGVELFLADPTMPAPSEHTSMSPYYLDTLMRCMRYYQKSYNYGVDPGTITDVGAITHVNALANTLAGTDRMLPIPMRNTPTAAYYSTVTGTVANIRNTTGAADVATTGTDNISMNSSGIPTVAALAADQEVNFHHTLTSEL